MKRKWISVLLIACMMLSMMPFSAFATEEVAETAETTDALWGYEIVDGAATLTRYNGTATDVYVPNTIEDNGVEYPVTKLGDSLFENNDTLNSATLGAGILEIGAKAFYDCDNLVCVLISEELTTIGEEAFYSCDVMNSIILYDTVTAIGTNAFAECPNLTIWCNEGFAGYNYAIIQGISYQILNPIATPDTIEFDNITYYILNGEAVATTYNGSATEVTIPSSINGFPVTELRATFNENSTIVKVNLPDSIKVLGENSFFECGNLKNVNIPKNLVTIGNYAFFHCYDLVSVDLPNTLKKIGISAFIRCSSLTSITIPESVTVIEKYAFSSCANLTSAKLPSKISYIPISLFSECRKLKSIEIPENVSRIYKNAFYNCENLTAITIPESVTSIDDCAFDNCNNLISIDIPKNVINIGYAAFRHCDNLASVTLSEGLVTIGKAAFLQCPKVPSILIPESVTSIGTNIADSSTVLFVYPDSYGETYAETSDLAYAIYDGTTEPEIYTENDVTYCIGGNEACAIKYSGTNSNLTIPATVKEVPVTSVVGTFMGCTSLTSVTLPDSIKTIGKNAFNNCANLTSVNIPAGVTTIGSRAFSGTSISNINLPEGLTSIGYYAFTSCEKLLSISLPNSVVDLKGCAFSGCTSLVSVVLSENLTTIETAMFSSCTSLKEISFPKNITHIDDCAFEKCSALTSVTIPDNVLTIGGSVFYNASNLKKVYLPQNNISYVGSGYCFPRTSLLIVYENTSSHTYAKDGGFAHYVWDGSNEPEFYSDDKFTYYISNGEATVLHYDSTDTTVIVPDSVNNIPVTKLQSTFYNCTDLTSVSLPSTLTSIDASAFYGCEKLTSISIPSSVVSIGAYAFYKCAELTAIDIPESVTSIGDLAFYDCLGLTSFVIPNSITRIERATFSGCKNMESITLPQDLNYIGNSVFWYCSNLQSIDIPENVTYIGEGAFGFCEQITSIQLPKGISTIYEDTFNGCNKLTSVIIPQSVTSIGAFAFYKCTSLASVTLPNNDRISIGSNAFKQCPALKTILLPQNSYITSNAFTASTLLILYEDTRAHRVAKNNNLFFFVLREDNNPETAYGTGISGTATYTDGTVAAGATAEIFYDDGTLKESVTVAEDGTYSFTYAEVGRYTVRVTDTAGNSASTQVSVKRMNVFDVFLEGDTALTLKKGWAVSGTVGEAATVTITDQEGNSIASVTTEDGTFSFANIPNGTYVIKAETETGSTAEEITVFDGNISDLTLTVVAEAVTLWGYVEVEDREFNHHRRNWVNVTVYNEEGIAVGQTKSDPDGKYTFENLPVGTYTIVAETTEMRPEKKKKYDRVFTLTGYAYVEAAEVGTYEVETIILYEENESKATISGKVTAQGESQDCEVVLRDVFRHEVAQYTTGKNGKYSFKNVNDGLYFITAITKSDGMGMAVVVVRNGKVYGETDITVRKNDKVLRQYEAFNQDVPECQSREEALQHKERIAEEKRLYDALSEKEKKQMPKDYAERLNRYAEWLTQVDYTAEDGATVEGGGLVISGEELEQNDSITFNLSVEKVAAGEVGDEGVHTREDFIHQSIRDTAKHHEIKQYYEISMTKTVDGEEKTITSVQKDTDSTGKFRITLPIPEEHRGYKHYSVIHVHHGKPVTLTDLDDDPNTVTFEVDQFSTFVLSASNTALTCETGAHTFEGETTVVPSTCTEAGTETGYCSVCEETVTMALPLVDHDYVDGTCSVCGQSINPNQWTYEAKGAYSVTLSFAEEIALTDTLCIYDANDVELGRYTAQELAGKSLTFLKESVKILRLTDETDTDFGFISADALMADTSGALRLLRKIDKVDTTLTDEAADINGDGKVTVYDAVRFLQLLNNTPVA